MLKKLITVFSLLIVTNSSFAQIKVAILPTTDKTGEIKYGLKLMLTSSLTSAISMTDGYEAYDRIDLSAVLDEQSFQRTGMVSDDQIHKIGEMTGASFVLITEAAYIDDTHLFATAKIVNVESAKIENSAGSMMNVGNTDQLLADCKALTDKLLAKTIITKKPQNKQVNNRTGMEDGHEYVDLGLSVKWSTCNIDAIRPEDYGGYYAWGENYTKDNYYWTSYRFRISGNDVFEVKFNKYNKNKTHGKIDNKTKLDLSDDVAHVKWGGSWRMPTKAEYDELLSSGVCTLEWTIQNGVNGLLITSNKYGYEGNSIFLPAGGFRDKESLYNIGRYCTYWTSSLSTSNIENEDSATAWTVYYSEYTDSWNALINNHRYIGHTIRPVCP